MQLEVLRYSSGDEATLGILFDVTRGRRFLAYTLEDEHREVKVAGETCIPAGVYNLELRKVGGFHKRYGDRYGAMHKGMLWVRGVPGFRFILIHTGNNDDHTEGCLLIGDSAIQNITEEGSIGASRTAYKRVYPPIARRLTAGKPVTIRYTDFDQRVGSQA